MKRRKPTSNFIDVQADECFVTKNGSDPYQSIRIIEFSQKMQKAG